MAAVAPGTQHTTQPEKRSTFFVMGVDFGVVRVIFFGHVANNSMFLIFFGFCFLLATVAFTWLHL